jgi:hypothetical protein
LQLIGGCLFWEQTPPESGMYEYSMHTPASVAADNVQKQMVCISGKEELGRRLHRKCHIMDSRQTGCKRNSDEAFSSNHKNHLQNNLCLPINTKHVTNLLKEPV